ncbi:hypothetical protein [Streptomyces rhizosphaerihabitans]|uniref:hypothetical protein n=1 Tax=Streptomyces rhizosphaerihabitans TaxID=1266770 RepID=UPI0021BDFCFA|nr:hypothetical protein [Streptomyces rhizosphaerihabitans]MCT9005386.1 hypothetical protein [Streptomyces rhizosphaerihabitans]
MNAEILAQAMKDCGLRFLGFRRGTGIPPYIAGMVTSCSPDEGRRDRTAALDDPALVPKANAGWFELATEFGLFSVDRQFLIYVGLPHPDAVDDTDVEGVWGLVELLDDWDIMGAGCAAGVTGSRRGRPAFVMSALDGSVFVQGTVWQDSIGTAVLPNPHRVQSLREVARLNVGKPYRTAAENEDTLAWLAR